MSRPKVLPLALLALAVLYAILVPWLHPLDPRAVDLGRVLQAPSAAHPFGTDQLGRDVWIRSAQALRLSLLLALLASAFSTVLGVGVGMLAAWRGGWVDRLAMRLVDTTNALPHLLLAVVIVALWRGEWWAIVLSIALTHWTQVARIVRSRLVSERCADYVALARASGAGTSAVWFTHLLPAVAPQAAIALVLQLPHAIWHESALSFLGVGLPPESASLGLLLEDARGGLLSGAWWLLAFPAGLLVLVSWSTASLVDVARIPRFGTFRSFRGFRPKPGSPVVARPGAPAKGGSAALEALDLDLWLPNIDHRDSKGPARTQILHRIDYRAQDGCINVILGRSGAGKTMLLRTLSGLLPAGAEHRGSILADGREMDAKDLAAARGTTLAYVPGSAGTALNPVRSVAAQLREILRAAGQPATAVQIHAALTEVGLDPGLAQRHAHEISGGQAQRVVLALGLATGANTLLIDEPTSALDAATVQVIERVLCARATAGQTIIMVTHDIGLALRLADHVAVVEAGRIVEAGPVEAVFGAPTHEFTRTLLGVGA
ncbi:ABC transporter permease subunit [Paeniglutamicibacter sp. NPDC091659]|uniref:ABC transporter permease subunit n=1 Tax=Paeniglutamicibacter sp. NPDC091659 TaxID=3364389 RepID=UPI003817AA87